MGEFGRGYVPPEEQREALDEGWYERFEKIGAFQAYEYLDGNKEYRDDQKNKFLSGEIENPILDYPLENKETKKKLDTDSLRKIEEELLNLKKDILAEEMNETVKQAYRWRLNEKIVEIRMLQAVEKGDMRWFKRYSEFVYGKPSPEIFSYTVQGLQESIKKSLSSENEEIMRAAQDLKDSLPTKLPQAEMKELPSEESVKYVHDAVINEMSDLLSIPIKEGESGAEDVKQVFEKALEMLQAEGWKVVIDRNKASLSVHQENKTINVPESKKYLYNTLKTLVVHEAGTHVKRRLNGERSRLKLLGLGLDRYEQGEEGVATMRESVLDNKTDEFSGLEGHLGISLASGLDGEKRDFRGVYTILEKHYYLKSLNSGKKPEAARVEAQTDAWNRTVRTFRGTDCKTPGVCFTKDIIYREGNISAWDVVRNNPSEVLRFSIGKYDPSNERHLWVLSQLGIGEDDMKQLDQQK